MPRIYYNQDDYNLHLFLFVAHAITCTVGTVFIWRQGFPFVEAVTFFWTMLLTFHSVWRTPLQDGMQVRTYTRLRNRFGQDWDLAATPEEFEYERQKATLESQLRYVFRDSVYALPASFASLIALSVILETQPVSIAMIMTVAYLVTVLILQLILRWQLRRTISLNKALKKKKKTNTYPHLEDVVDTGTYQQDLQEMDRVQSQDGA